MDLTEYQLVAMSTRTAEALPFTYPTLGLAGEAGEVAENIKKMIRDDDGILTPERRLNLLKEMGDVLWYLAALATDAQISFNEVADENLAKLRSRQERGVISGSGDDR